MGKASKKKEQRRQGKTNATPSSGPAAIPKWPDNSVGDRFFGTHDIAEAATAPLISNAALPRPAEMAVTPELWQVASNVLVRAVALDGRTPGDPAVLAVLELLMPVVKREISYYADESTWDEYPEAYVPLRFLGEDVLMNATWAIVGDDSLEQVLALLESHLDAVFDGPPGMTGTAAAEALIRAFPDHFECTAPRDAECLQRLHTTGRGPGNPLLDLVGAEIIAPEDSLSVGLAILAALANLARTSSLSVLDSAR